MGLLAAGVLAYRANATGRAAGITLLVVASCWYFLLLRGIVRSGLIWNWSWYPSASDLPWHVDRRFDVALIAVWLLLSAGLVWSLARRRRDVA
jgi:hypothetical protein